MLVSDWLLWLISHYTTTNGNVLSSARYRRYSRYVAFVAIC